MKISEIQIPRNRARKNMGDIDALAASMADVGQLQPVLVDEHGILISGARRVAAAKKLGWTEIKTVVAHNLQEMYARLKAERDENVCRENFTPSEAVAMADRVRPLEEKAAKERQKEHGKTAPGKKNTCAKVAQVMDEKSSTRTAAAVGMSRPTLEKARAVVQAAQAEPEKFGAALELMDSTGKVSKAHQAVKLIQKREAAVASAAPTSAAAYRLIACDIQKHAGLDIPTDSIDAIITDPAYLENMVPLYAPLAELAERVLKPGAPLVVMTAHYTLPKVMQRLGKYLQYWWIAAYLTPRSEARVFSRKALVGWKPVLVYTKGAYTGEWFKDVAESASPDKRYHDWGQSESGMAALVEAFTQPGATVLDPFCGGGATGVAAVRLGRKFIGLDLDEASIKLTAQRLEQVSHDAGDQPNQL